jgi:hypothetical protein
MKDEDKGARLKPMRRSGTADLPLHGGRVPPWLANRMTELGTAIAEQVILHYGSSGFLSRLSDPFWFQAYGAVMGMDWHSSGITTSVLGALKRGMNSRFSELGIMFCGGRGRHSIRTPEELRAFSLKTGLDGDALARTSRLTARVDNNAIADGFQLYLHSFAVTASVLRRSLDRARLGHTEKLEGFRRLDRLTRDVEARREPVADFEAAIKHERTISSSIGGRTVFDDEVPRKSSTSMSQLNLF